ncbi:VOC family protein [Belliella marina]|uniref:VOC family protein n=1 Tax=Belliella marina TaxID=1644146 RepID=A0ABW4VP97_9BACT
MSQNNGSLPIVSGIQQVGIGVKNAKEAWAWYRKYFKMDVPIFEDAATANLMTKYTSGKAQERYAILALNMQGGGGFEIWQYTNKIPAAADFQLSLGDLGIFAVKIRTKDIQKTYDFFVKEGLNVQSEPKESPCGRSHFYVSDPYGNMFEMIESTSWFKLNQDNTGGVAGVSIGVRDIDQALKLYQEILGYTAIKSDETGTFEDLHNLPGGREKFRRVLLNRLEGRVGAFSRLLCKTEIELFELKDKEPNKIFANRDWGDLGFIHVCFDITGMKSLEKKCAEYGFPFTVDSSNSFDMGKAAGHFSYCEDPDGTLIEFVETHKVPIMEKWGWYLNLKNRKAEKPLPNWMFSFMSLNRKK